jgi:transcriptional regulator with XRE-family HTH domain
MSPVNVGQRIRQLRLAARMSVRALASTSGFSPSLISQIEHNQVRPSIGSLERIALALGVSLSQFFATPERRATRLVRADARPHMTSTWSPVAVEALGPLDGSSPLEPVLLTMEPGGRSGRFPETPRADKFAFLVAGEVTLTLGEAVYSLQTGDAITFTPALPHQWENSGPGPATLVLVTWHPLP